MKVVSLNVNGLVIYLNHMIGLGAVRGVTSNEKSRQVVYALMAEMRKRNFLTTNGVKVPQGDLRTEIENSVAEACSVSTEYAGTAYYCLKHIDDSFAVTN